MGVAMAGPKNVGVDEGAERDLMVATLRRWRRRLRWAAAVVTVLLGLGMLADVLDVGGKEIGAADSQRLDSGPLSGPAPTFALPSLEDPAMTVALADYRGRPVVLNFWASWCVPCRREMPRLAAADRRVGDKIAFVGINYQDQRDDAAELARDTGVAFPSGIDSDGAVGRRYGLYGMPTTIFIDAQGEIVARHLGELSADALDDYLELLLTPGRD